MPDQLPDSLLPADVALNAAVASVTDPIPAEAVEDPVIPLGRSWAFDWERGRFKRQGGAPAETRGADTLIQWLEMARRSARGAHDVFSVDFGMDDPESWQGTIDVEEAASDYGAKLKEAWGVHDRVADPAANYAAHFEADVQTIFVDRCDVITDQEESVPMAGPAPFYAE